MVLVSRRVIVIFPYSHEYQLGHYIHPTGNRPLQWPLMVGGFLHVNNFAIPLQVLLSRVNFFDTTEISDGENIGLQMYRKTAEAVICGLLPDSPTATSSRTDSNILFWYSFPGSKFYWYFATRAFHLMDLSKQVLQFESVCLDPKEKQSIIKHIEHHIYVYFWRQFLQTPEPVDNIFLMQVAWYG